MYVSRTDSLCTGRSAGAAIDQGRQVYDFTHRLHHNRIALGVGSLRAQISDLNRSTVLKDTRNWSAWAGTKDWLLRDLISPGGRRSVQRGSPQAFAVE